jgi:hypothetical protein
MSFTADTDRILVSVQHCKVFTTPNHRFSMISTHLYNLHMHLVAHFELPVIQSLHTLPVGGIYVKSERIREGYSMIGPATRNLSSEFLTVTGELALSDLCLPSKRATRCGWALELFS